MIPIPTPNLQQVYIVEMGKRPPGSGVATFQKKEKKRLRKRLRTRFSFFWPLPPVGSAPCLLCVHVLCPPSMRSLSGPTTYST